MSVRLFTSYYKETDSARKVELLTCLHENLDLDTDNTVFFLENVDLPVVHPKLVTRAIR